MPKPSRESQPDPVSREVDRLLAGLATNGSGLAHTHGPSGQTPRYFVSRARSTAAPASGDRIALWVRVLLGLLLGGAITQWPYPHGCGWPLAGYLAAVAMIGIAGAWIAVVSWKLKAAVAHILALMILGWGIALAAAQVLPRVGYAAVHASWGC